MEQFLAGVKAVIFDIGNTLVYPDWERISEVAGQFGSAKQNLTDLHAKFCEILAFADGDERFLRMLSTNDVESGWHFRTLYRESGVSEDVITALWRALEASHRDRHLWARLNPDAKPVLRELKQRGYRLAAISNSEDGTISHLLDETGLSEFLEFHLDSFVVGVAKPDPRIFNMALDRLAIAPKEALFVGDTLKQDINGAQASGLRAVLFDPGDLRTSAPVGRIAKLTELLQ